MCTGHGAAPWMMKRSDDRSDARRTSSGRASMRWNMVGTMWVWVIPCRSMSRSVSAGSQCSMITSGTPYANGTATEKANGAAW